MSSATRRQTILSRLKETRQPITGGQLSEDFGVTRQVIVADIALLRAEGEDIIGTPQGYMYSFPRSSLFQQKIATIHSSKHEHIREELNIIVDAGAAIEDVIVDHPLYGQITASLHIYSRHDVEQFMRKLAISKAEPLLVLTDGLHLHTITAANGPTLKRVKDQLDEKGYLARDI